MKTMQCPHVNADVRVDITHANCASVHECVDVDSCPLDDCFSKQKNSTLDAEINNPSNPSCKFGDIA